MNQGKLKQILMLFVLLILSIQVINMVSAETYTPDEFLNNITNLTDNSVIIITNGTANISHSYKITANNITIMGNGTIFQGNSADTHFNVSGNRVSISGITFTNAFSRTGGALYWAGDNGTVKNCNFTNNMVYGESVFSEDVGGGAILWRGVNGTLENCNFINSTSSIEGGAILWLGDYGVVNNCSFINNTADSYGGAISCIMAIHCIFKNCRFINNTGNEGGAIYLDGGIYDDYATLKNCIFINNTANRGSAISFTDVTATVENCNFTDCHNASAIYCVWGDKSHFINCNLFNSWGFIALSDSPNSTVENCNFINTGGAVSISRSHNCTVKDCNFIINNTNTGSAVYCYYSNNFIIENCNFINNTADEGAAIFCQAALNGVIRNCNFTNCTANKGSAIFLSIYTIYTIYSKTDNITLIDNNFINCKSTGDSIANIYNNNTSNLNVIGGNGAIIYNHGTNASISSPVTVLIMNNETIVVSNNTKNRLYAQIITGNAVIIGNDFNFTVRDSTIQGVLNGTFYICDYVVEGTLGEKIPIYGSSNVNATNILYRTATLQIKENTILNITVGYPDDDDATLYLNVTSISGKLIDGTVIVNVTGPERFNRVVTIVDGRGNTNLQNLTNGKYTVIANFVGDDYYNSSFSNTTFTINYKPIMYYLNASNVDKSFMNDTQYHVLLTDNRGKIVADKVILVTLTSFKWAGPAYYNITTNESGVATLNINLAPGKYDIVATFENAAAYNNITVRRIIYTLESNDVIKYYKNGTQYTVKLTDKQGDVGVNQSVIVTLNSQSWTKTAKYTITTDSNGIATLTINLAPGIYTITATSEGVSKINNIVVFSTLTANSLTKKITEPAKLTARVVDGQGNPSTNKTVTFKVKTKVYTLTTDSEGIATLPINLGLGTWSILISSADAQTRVTVKVTK